ncbi:Eco57I restriction-modification methylase domain-containing protein [Cryobacterium sp. N21]|uniref:Eco57I restriction-modification methylase domain-containing protein n=1 Tax=Cryobacterium sp. N21 TaxID=2048289 RepID=UPI000CE2DF20|nr:Eco57I restriction-modification methylase domain-containing protein [Cryobacterium sp. N21]
MSEMTITDLSKNGAALSFRVRKPDVLNTIANLSNDEVFTPPEFAGRMLDTLADAWAVDHDGASIWADPTVTFLDPFTKSGVFPREITRRLVEGLESWEPDLDKRVDHILMKQVHGIAITTVTSLLARRSLYCSKDAMGEHSIAKSFTRSWGNIWFKRTEHNWSKGTPERQIHPVTGDELLVYPTCGFCGAPRSLFGVTERDDLETHAYEFIHTDDPNGLVSALFGVPMQFDVVIGNPPYQMTGGAGGSSDSSIYHLFVEQAQKLEPRYLSMVIPSRWLAGGRGMDGFRAAMLGGGHIRELVDFPAAAEVFPGVEVKGGICYFLWESAYEGDAKATIVRNGEPTTTIRDLGEFDVFVRDPRAIGILQKVRAQAEPSVVNHLTADTPFGIATNFADFREAGTSKDVELHYIKRKRAVGFVPRSFIRKNAQLIDSWKVLATEGYNGGDGTPHQIVGRPLIAGPGSVCTQSYLAFWVDTEIEAKSLMSYYSTKFFRFLVSLRKITQHALRSTYTWVPQQEWDRAWTDADLYAKYGLSADEIAYIESVIKPMVLAADEGAED